MKTSDVELYKILFGNLNFDHATVSQIVTKNILFTFQRCVNKLVKLTLQRYLTLVKDLQHGER